MSNLIDLNAYRKDGDQWDRLVDDETIDVFMAAFWIQSSLRELREDNPQLRLRTLEAMRDVRDYLRGRDDAA